MMRAVAKRRRHRKQKIWHSLFGIVGFGALVSVISWLVWTNTAAETYEMTTHDEFVTIIGQYAVADYPRSKILPSVVTAQAALESDYGSSDLSRDYNNLFGYKASPGERSVRMPTKEFKDGEWQTIEDDFKVYRSWKQSVRGHGDLMQHGVSWDHELYRGVIEATDYQAACYALETAGYATDPGYAEKLIQIIEDYHLEQLDQQVQ